MKLSLTLSQSLAAFLATTMIAPSSFADLSLDLNQNLDRRGRGGFNKIESPGAFGRKGGFGREIVQPIPMHDKHYTGSSTIFLKQQLKQKGVHTNGLKLIAVKLIAKTKHGQGTAAVKIGNNTSRKLKIAGHPSDFNRPRPRTFDRKDLIVPRRGNQNGVWQVKLNGNFKVRRVKVTMQPMGGQVKEITLSFNGSQFQGQSRIGLKQQLQRQKGINVSKFELKSVTLKAKTRHGQGSASVLVGNLETNRKRIAGNPRIFNTNRLRTYDTRAFNVPKQANQNGRWQVLLNGNFKVHSITVKLKKKGFGRH